MVLLFALFCSFFPDFTKKLVIRIGRALQILRPPFDFEQNFTDFEHFSGSVKCADHVNFDLYDSLLGYIGSIYYFDFDGLMTVAPMGIL